MGRPYGRAVFTRSDDIPDELVAEALGAGWGLSVDEIEYAPVGYGGHHWRAVSGGGRWFVTVDDLAADGRDPHRLAAALTTARALRDAGLDFVVAPRPTGSGGVLHVAGDRFAVSLYPHVDGVHHEWGPYPSRGDRLAVLDLVVAIHGAPVSLRGAALVDDLAIPDRDRLVAALDGGAGGGRHERGATGPFGEPARALLDRHASDVRWALQRHDELARAVAARPDRMVLTHGEPHRGNTIATPAGVVLVGWDTALVAPPERDLWTLADQEPEILGDYTTRTGVTPDPDALALYRLGWDLTEITIFVDVFGRPHAETEDTLVAWDGFRRALDPARWRAAL